MKHNSAIKILQFHLKKLNEALIQEEKNIEEPEMMADYHFSLSNAYNIEQEINSITESIEVLIKL